MTTVDYLAVAERVIEQLTVPRTPQPDMHAGPAKSESVGEYEINEVNEITTNLEAPTLLTHLHLLYPAIRRGCQMGLQRHLERTPAEVIRGILVAADPAHPFEVTRERCQMAGEAATLAALIAEYRERLRLLTALGEDVFREAAALELCLIHEEASCGDAPHA